MMKMFSLIAVVLVFIGVTDAAVYPTDVTLQIACTELSVTATWTKNEFGAGNVTKIEWNEPACQGFQENHDEFWTTTNFSECQSVIIQNNDTIVMGNTARVHVAYKVDIVQRDIIYDFLLRCSMQRSIYTPLGTSYNVTEKRFFGSINRTSSADFNIRMDIYKTDAFIDVLNNPTATSFDPIFIGIREVNDNKLLKFVVQQCFATPSSDRRDVNYLFFYKQCPVDESFLVIASNSEHHYNFRVEAFKFIRLSKSVYIHCRLAVCKTDATSETCIQEKDCNTRRRRDVSLAADNDKPLEEITVMTARLTFVEHTCKQMPCPTFSSCVDLNPPVCRCGHGYVLNADTNSCSRERTFVIYGLHFDTEFVPSYLDPYAKSFVSLVTRMEKQLNYFVRQLNNDSIVGIKVINAREGSVVVDVRVIYQKSSNENKAYATFLKAVSKSHTQTLDYEDALTIKSITPTMRKEDDTSDDTVILSVVIPLVVVVLIVAVVVYNREKLLPCRRREKIIEEN